MELDSRQVPLSHFTLAVDGIDYRSKYTVTSIFHMPLNAKGISSIFDHTPHIYHDSDSFMAGSVAISHDVSKWQQRTTDCRPVCANDL
jgi:hypothetical protein